MFRNLLASLQSRLALLVFLSFMPLAGLILFTSLELRQTTMQADALRIARLANFYQEQLVEDTYQTILVMAQISALQKREAGPCNALLGRLTKKLPSFASFVVADPQGNLFCSSFPMTQTINVADRAWFKEALQKRDFIASDYILGRGIGKFLLPIAYPIYDETGKLAAVVSTGLDFGWLERFAQRVALPPGMVLTIIDDQGTVLGRYPPLDQFINTKLPNEAQIRPLLATQAESTAEAVGLDGVPRLYAFKKITGIGNKRKFFISVGIPTDLAYQNLDKALPINLGGWGALTCLGLMLAWWGINLLVLRPTKTLLGVAQRVAAGDFKSRSGLTQKAAATELQQLALAFDHMSAALAEREIELKQAETQYRALVEQVPTVIYTAMLEKGSSSFTLAYISPQVTTLTGYTVAECLVETNIFAEWVHPEDRPYVLAEMTRLFSVQRGSWALEYRLITKHKQLVWINNEANLLYTEAGQPNLIQGTLTDITERKQAQHVIELQAAALRDLSTPIMQISDNAILLPMIGAIDSHRAKQTMELALSEIEKRRVKVIIIDITGVSVVDSQVANALIQTTQAIKLLGACAVLTGIRSEVAQSIVALGIDLNSIVVHSTLQNGIAYALKHQKQRKQL